jgi:hypothetical protein
MRTVKRRDGVGFPLEAPPMCKRQNTVALTAYSEEA